MRPRRLITGFFAALLAFGTPGAAMAETDIVLQNESEGTTVQTGEASFENSDNVSAGGSVSSDQTSNANSGASVGGQVAGTTEGAPAATSGGGGGGAGSTAAAPAGGESNDPLFVGFAPATSSVI